MLLPLPLLPSSPLGFHRWSAEIPAVLQSLCSQHPPHPQLVDHQLPVSQSGTPAEVRLNLSAVTLLPCVNFTPFFLQPWPFPAPHRISVPAEREPWCRRHSIKKKKKKELKPSLYSKVPVRALLRGRPFGCRPGCVPCGEAPFICKAAVCQPSGLRAAYQMGCGVLSAQRCASLLRVLSCCPTCTTRRRITAATRTTLCCCRCWRAAANPTLGQFSHTGSCVFETNDFDP